MRPIKSTRGISMLQPVFLTLTLLWPALSNAQFIVGFWEVTEVTVGKDIKTPVAKWTKINADGSFQSGNGWLQNSEGTWTYVDGTKYYRQIESNGIKDEFGAFKVSFEHDDMIWQREEDGDEVRVKLQRITKLPKSPADLLVGIWSLNDFIENGTSRKKTFDPNNKHFIFIRWDRIYLKRNPDGEKTSGYWHIDGHKPELTFISHSEGKEHEKWKVSVNDDELRMTGISESNKNSEMRYNRINDFPK